MAKQERPNDFSAARPGERDRPETFGYVGDSRRGGDGRTDGAGVNYWGKKLRREGVWLPERNMQEMENSSPGAVPVSY